MPKLFRINKELCDNRYIYVLELDYSLANYEGKIYYIKNVGNIRENFWTNEHEENCVLYLTE
jgi:hypothetical protein